MICTAAPSFAPMSLLLQELSRSRANERASERASVRTKKLLQSCARERRRRPSFGVALVTPTQHARIRRSRMRESSPGHASTRGLGPPDRAKASCPSYSRMHSPLPGDVQVHVLSLVVDHGVLSSGASLRLLSSPSAFDSGPWLLFRFLTTGGGAIRNISKIFREEHFREMSFPGRKA